MRILHIVHQYMPDHVGGVELYTQWVTRALGQSGQTVAIFTRRDRVGHGWTVQADEAGVAVYSAWAGELTPGQRYLVGFHSPALVDAFRQAVAHFQPDLIHIEHLMGLPVGIMGVIQAAGLPYVVTLHDFWWICANANLLTNYSGANCAGPVAHLNCTRCVVARSNQAAAWLAAPLITGSLVWRAHQLRTILAGAAQVITPSAFMRDWYAAHGVDTHQLRVLAPGVEEPPAPLPVRQRRQDEPLRLLYLGSIARIKGVHIVVAALRQVQGAVELWIAGDLTVDPAYSAELCQLATEQVTFLGRLDRAGVWQTLAQVDAVLVPSLSNESYCFVAREAFAAGVPIIVAEIGALAEVVRHKVDGLLVAAGDTQAWQAAIQSVIDDPEQLERFRTAIHQPPGWPAHIAQMNQLYTAIVQGD